MLARLKALLRRNRLDRDLQEEMESHISHEVERQMARGHSAAEAQAIARRQFGNLAALTEAGHEALGWRPLDQLGQDLRYGIRTLRRAPGFTAVAVLSLALGIGSNTAIYTLIYDVLLQPLAVEHPEQLALVVQTKHGERSRAFSSPGLAELRRSLPGVSLTGLRAADNMPLTVGASESFVGLEFVDDAFATTVGAPLARGRLITREDVDRHVPVAIVSARLATSRFGGVDSAVGRSVRVHDRSFTIVGVLSREYRGLQYPGGFEMAVPLSLTGDLGLPDPSVDTNQTFTVVARTGPRGGWTALSDRLTAAFRSCCGLEASDRLTLEPMTGGIGGGKGDARAELAPMLYALFGCVCIVLLIACANVGTLLLLRAAAREREIMVRLSLGSSRWRIVRQLLTECALLGAGAVVLGLCFAAWTRGILVRTLPGADLELAELTGFRPTPRALLFGMMLGLVAVVVTGLTPALRATRPDLTRALRTGGRSAGGAVTGRLGRGLVITQVALALALITGGLLLVATVKRLVASDIGIGTTAITGFDVEARGTRYEASGVTPLLPDLERALVATPGLASVGMATYAPLFGGRNMQVRVESPGRTADRDEALFAGISNDYFRTTGIALVRGRAFSAEDQGGTEAVVIVSESVARGLGGDAALGQTVHLADWGTGTRRIVGIARDARLFGPRDGTVPAVYVPLTQIPRWPYVEVIVRAAPGATIGPRLLTETVTSTLPGIRVRNLYSGRDRLATWVLPELIAASLTSIFAALALGLAALGLYGVVAYNVARRTSEIGVRMALGASGRTIGWLVIRDTLMLAGAGFLIGVPLALAAGRALKAMLYQISGLSPLPILGGIALLLLAALGAAAVPVRRAIRVEPMASLRTD